LLKVDPERQIRFLLLKAGLSAVERVNGKEMIRQIRNESLRGGFVPAGESHGL
jgi:hypothetical protein